jgi:membrane protein DedA with SNARE-associated domain
MGRVRRSGTAAIALLIPAALHFHFGIHVHHRLHGSPIDYVGLAAASAASFIGVPGPGEPVLIAAGVLASRHRLDLGEVLVVAWAAAAAGGIAGWAIGLKAGRGLVTARGPLRSMRLKALERGEVIFDRHPVAAILLTPAWVAGIHRVRPWVYHLTNVVSAALWAGGIGVGAYFAGPAVTDWVNDFGTGTSVIVVVVIVGGVALELVRRRRRKRRRLQGGGAK